MYRGEGKGKGWWPKSFEKQKESICSPRLAHSTCGSKTIVLHPFVKSSYAGPVFRCRDGAVRKAPPILRKKSVLFGIDEIYVCWET